MGEVVRFKRRSPMLIGNWEVGPDGYVQHVECHWFAFGPEHFGDGLRIVCKRSTLSATDKNDFARAVALATPAQTLPDGDGALVRDRRTVRRRRT